ncbi:unnamed protein product [Cyprideis torosa]|uniref:Uncharacterized protein n=1 Tax=Cyprideis torosa TaxID=163714 RepID=A0A7R8W612_9CRUS|nr:unnamed protein product [Cyprideis torosa]CAG0880515.1 unnamed protein product [Cyprideis torosa]
MVVSEGQLHNIVGGMEGTTGVKLNTHKQKLRHRFDIVRKLGQGTYGKVQLAVNKETAQEIYYMHPIVNTTLSIGAHYYPPSEWKIGPSFRVEDLLLEAAGIPLPPPKLRKAESGPEVCFKTHPTFRPPLGRRYLSAVTPLDVPNGEGVVPVEC